jgi:transcriptional regulator with XRE-family HTH domain
MEFKDRLKQLRDAKGWTQQQLASASGLGQRSVSNLEQGRNKPTWDSVIALARALGVSCEAFMAARGSAKPEPKRGRGRPPKNTSAKGQLG